MLPLRAAHRVPGGKTFAGRTRACQVSRAARDDRHPSSSAAVWLVS
jgi:hypothetical protein